MQVEAGDLALDTASFVPETFSLESLLTELNSDITSGGQPVAFVYDEAQNAIIGTQEGNEVLRIEIEATSLGRDLELEVVTTISQGIDHVASVADGQVSIVGDQINIAFDITGADIGGNSIQAPIDFTTTIIDGDDPAPQNVTFENVESSSAPITGTFVDIGSDQLATVTFDQEGLSQFDGLLSDNQATEAVLSEDGSTITLSIAGSSETVLTISLNTDGNYQFEQFKPLEQTNGEDTIELSLPTTIVDFDQDTASNTFTMTILDGDNPVIENVTGLSLDEAGVDQGSQEGTVVTSGSGSIKTAVGSDIIDHYELEPTEFNVGGELQSQGQVVQLELASESNGVRTYEGFIELDGVRITVFDVAIDAPALGEYQFDLYEQLDHKGANDDSLTFSLPVYAVDADGDRSSITEGSNTPEAAQIVIQVQDDVPSIDGVEALAVDEDDLSSIGSDQSDSVLAQGNFTATQGSDRVVSYQLESGTDPLNGLESQGRSISLTETTNSDGSFTYSATAEGDAIFTLKVNPDGSYSFTLEGPIDHAVGSDSLTLDFNIVATDFDGDTSSLVLPVTIADDVPTINDVVALTVDEDDLSSVGSDQSQPTLVEGQFTTTQGSNGVVQYQLDVNADPLNGLRSQGQTVSIAETQNADGSYTYSATANGSAVFTLILNTDGSYSFELQGPIDHAANSDSLTLDFSVIATDFDGDTSQIALPVTIVDDKPTITDVDAITVDEDDSGTIGSDQTDPISIDGNFTTTQDSDRVVSYQLDASATPVAGLTSQGVAVTLTETANGDGSFTYEATAGTEAVFTLTVNSDGSYNFTLEGPIDHAVDSDELTLNFPIIATDFDGDTTNATIPVTIVDDKPVIIDVDAITVDEDDLASTGSDQSNPISIDGNFNTTQGSDRVVSYQLDGTSTPVDGLTSQGVAVTLTETANGDGSFTYEATAGSEAVFTLTVNTDGSYNFTLEGPIDHAVDSDELTLNFPIIATDFDRDTVTETIPVTIVDDVPTITAVDALSVDEDDLSGVGSDPGGVLFVEGAFTTTQGSDRVVSYQLDSTADPVAGLTSQGEAIILVETANGDGSFTYVATADGNPVFTLNVATDGTYDFTLQGPIDHAANSDSLTIDFPIIATDFDGDTTSATIPVTITDDAPIIDNVVPLAVDEDDLSGIGSDQSDAVYVEGAFTTTQGSDRVVSYQLDSTSDPVAGLTSQGEPVTLVETANADGSFTYVATADGNPVFTMNVNADGTYNFRLEGPVDHALNSDELVLNFPIIATDFDGDTTTATIPVTITDDVPTIDNVVPLTVDEDDLASIGSDQNDDAFMSGSFTTTEGSDSVVKYQLDATADPVAGLTSHGEPVVLAEAANGDGSFTYTATADGNAVFELVVKPDGSYTFTLQGPLDHAVNSDSLQIDFPIIATDFDGDTSTETLPVTIVDDKPTITDVDAITVDEDDLETIGSDGSDPISIDGNFTTTQGSDGVVSYQLDASATPVDGLTSQGVAVTLTETANGDGSYTYEATAGTDAVFTLTVNTDGSYNFTLQGPIDHAVGSDELTLNFPIIATDFDGDTTTETIPVTIVDDKPTITDVDAITVDEDDLAGGSDTTSSDSTVLIGGFEVVDGADEIVSYQVSDLNSVVSGLTSNGQNIELNLVSTVGGVTSYEAVITGTSTKIFTLSLDANNDSYQFELLGPIDHDAVQGENNLVIDIPITVTDFDGDTSSSLNLPITIVDDIPEITSADALSLDEDDLVNGSQLTNKDSLEATGNFDTVEGADTVVSYQLDLTSNPIPGVTSGGLSVTLVQTAVSNNNYTYQGQTPDGNSVFTLELNADGSYKFTLEGILDHPVQGEDELTLNLPVFATDVDGDTAGITLPVSITDDVPNIYDASISRVEGQGGRTVQLFTDPVEGDLNYGADGAEITSFTADNSGIYFKQNGVDSDTIDLNGSDQTVFVHKVLDGVDTEIGRLVVRTDGRVTFRPNDDIDHTETDSIDFTINVVATDGDGDTSDADVDISVTDRNAQIDTSTVLAFEDQGRGGVVAGIDSANTQDNLSALDITPAKVDLVINLHDIDLTESLGDITIRDASTHNGTFYYKDGSGNYIELTPVGNTVVLDASNVEQSFSGEFVTLENLYFVPDRHSSTDASGINPRIRVEILNNGTPDHTINGRLDIEVDAVADIATWNASSIFDYTVDEDGNNVQLDIEANTQDISNPEAIVYELVFTEGGANATLVYSDGTPIPEIGGKYLVDASRIDEVEVDPSEHFSGQIKLDVTAITTESTNPLTGKETARSETEEIVIDVSPVADQADFVVNRINIFEDNARTQDTVDPVTDHDPLQLSEVITMTPSVDIDGSEELFVRISNFSENGVTFVWLDNASPSQINTVTDGGGNVLYYEIPEANLADVEVLPPLHSNKDFTFDVEVIVKDNASLSSGSAQNILSLGTQTVNVAVKGVADIPDVVLSNQSNNSWSIFDDGTTSGIETTIPEDGAALLNFSVVSGEVKDKPLDTSESLTVVLSNIPDGVQLVDSDGGSVDLTYVGTDINGNPIYEANITGLNFNSGIQIIPESSSTENIHITGSIIVTEDDGHTRIVEREIRVKVEPEIDAQDNYVVSSEGNEDTRINIDWQPTLTQSPDADEFYAELTISGFPAGSTVYVDGVAQTVTGGSITLTPAANESEQDFSARVSQDGYIQVQLEQDSSTDFSLSTQVTVKEIDAKYVDASNPGEGIASAVINGTVNVTVNPIVEAEDLTGPIADQTRLLVEGAGGTTTDIVSSDALGHIDFTINTSAGGQAGANIIKYQEFDNSSDEVVTQLVVQFSNTDPEILDQLIIVGASNEGGGRWTITDEENFSIIAPAGLDLTPNDDSDDADNGGISSIGLTIFAQVNDLGEDAVEKDATVIRQTDITLEFPTDIAPQTSVAAEIDLDNTVQIDANEDNLIDFGSQLTSKLTTINSDGVEDVLTVVIDPSAPGAPPGLVVVGTDVDFVDGKYVFQAGIDASGNITGLDSLTLRVGEDWAGDFELPVIFVTTDTLSGDEKSTLESIPVQVLPIADVPSSSGDQPLDTDVTPDITLDITGTLGLDADKQPVNDLTIDVPTNDGVGYEDGLIQLNLNIDFADDRNGILAGRETLTNVRLTLDDTTLGEFVDSSGNSLGTSVEFSAAEIAAGALDEVLFKPKENYPVGGGQNTVQINIEGEITDTALIYQTTLANPGDNVDVRTFTDSLSFEITPVVDDITISGADPTQPIEISGDEDTLISLSQSGTGLTISLNDNDGSEEFVSLKLTGLPTDFLVDSSSSDYTVKNNGGGEWSIQLANPGQTSIDLSDIEIQPPKNFSGEVDIGITVFTQEELLKVPTEHTGTFKVTIDPIGEDVDVNPDSLVSGNEGEDIDININALVVDNKESIGDGANYQENDPETLRVEITNVPDGASIELADGTAFVDQGGGVFVLEIDAQDLDKVVFNSGDRNDNSWNGTLGFKVQAVDTGLDGSQSLGTPKEFDVNVEVEAVNDRPEFVNTVDVETPEDTPLLLDGFSITDVDAVLDDPSAEYVLDVTVDNGILALNPTLVTNYNLTVSGDDTDSVELKGTVADLNNAIANGLIEFNPDLNFFGDVQVDVTIDDQGNEGLVIGGVDDTLNTNSSSFTIEVTEVNDTPETTPVSLADIAEDSGVFSISEAELIANATDIENDNLTVSNVQVTDPNSGSVSFNNVTGEWEFTPAPDYNGPVELTYDITDDGTTNGAPDLITIVGTAVLNVEATNDSPEITAISVTDAINEADGQKITGISVSDIDFTGAQANELMTVTLSVTEGDVRVEPPVGSGVTVGAGIAGEVILMGTQITLTRFLVRLTLQRAYLSMREMLTLPLSPCR